MATLSGFTRWLNTYLQINLAGPRLKANGDNLQIRSSGDTAWRAVQMEKLQLNGSNAANTMTITVPTLAGNLTITLPANLGNPGDFLQGDGAGGLIFAPAVSNADLTFIELFNQGTTSPLTLLPAPPANSYLRGLVAVTLTAAGGGAPTITVGTVASPALYMGATENSLLVADEYHKPMSLSLGATPPAIVATIVPNAQTFTGHIMGVYSNPV